MSLGFARQRNLWDGIAIGLSATCLVHCLALPLAVALLPAWSAWLGLPHGTEMWILIAAAPISLLVLTSAWRDRHPGGGQALGIGLTGLLVMACASALEGSAAEPFVTSAGALLLATAHGLSWRRRTRCLR